MLGSGVAAVTYMSSKDQFPLCLLRTYLQGEESGSAGEDSVSEEELLDWRAKGV